MPVGANSLKNDTDYLQELTYITELLIDLLGCDVKKTDNNINPPDVIRRAETVLETVRTRFNLD